MTLVVKLGSSIVAADDGDLRTDVLDSVCEQVAELRQRGEDIVMVTSGAVARGRWLKQIEFRPKAIDELQAASAIGQASLFRAYEERLTRRDIQTAQVLLTAADIAARTNYLNARQTLRKLIKWGVIPVINENDTTATDELTFGDNDFLAAQVAILLDARLLVLLTNTEGLFSGDPHLTIDPNVNLIKEIESFDELEELNIGSGTSAFGSGGMRSKVAAASMASEAGIPAVICSGIKRESLCAAAAGEPIGTRFLARERMASDFKLWLKYAKPTHGRLEVDGGAARMLREKGSSLLSVGIVRVEGRFSPGDAVEVAADGCLIGKGIVAYSAQELDRVKGLKSAAVRELLPHSEDEVIHRDRFVLV